MMQATLKQEMLGLQAAPSTADTLLSIALTVNYPNKPGVLRDLSLDLQRGEILGLVGESGCGKSTLALAILRLLHLKSAKGNGSIIFDGRDLMLLKQKEMRTLRGREIGLVLQSPMSSLNPSLRIGRQLEEAWSAHARTSLAERKAAIAQTLESVSLPWDEAFLGRFPEQLSIGQAQRVLIGMSVLHRPRLLIADEPTSALDIVTQSEILQLFARLSRQLGMSVLYISHDLPSVAMISQRVAVMEKGRIVECRRTTDLFTRPTSDYTRMLIAALPQDPRLRSAASQPAHRERQGPDRFHSELGIRSLL